MELRLELVTVPVADVDRAKSFYVDQIGFTVEQDVRVDDDHRFVELMPPGSPCSIALTAGYVDNEPGSLKGIQLNVDDAAEVHAMLRERGVEVSDLENFPWVVSASSPIPTATAGQFTNPLPRAHKRAAYGPPYLRPGGTSMEPAGGGPDNAAA